jgi:hypothetical protein
MFQYPQTHPARGYCHKVIYEFPIHLSEFRVIAIRWYWVSTFSFIDHGLHVSSPLCGHKEAEVVCTLNRVSLCRQDTAIGIGYIGRANRSKKTRFSNNPLSLDKLDRIQLAGDRKGRTSPTIRRFTMGRSSTTGLVRKPLRHYRPGAEEVASNNHSCASGWSLSTPIICPIHRAILLLVDREGWNKHADGPSYNTFTRCSEDHGLGTQSRFTYSMRNGA